MTAASERLTYEQKENPEVEEAALCSLLRQHGSVAIAGLVRMIHTSRSDRLRVSAINMLLDLGYGRPPRASDIADRNPPPVRPYIERYGQRRNAWRFFKRCWKRWPVCARLR